MKKSIVTIGLFSLMMILTSFTTSTDNNVEQSINIKADFTIDPPVGGTRKIKTDFTIDPPVGGTRKIKTDFTIDPPVGGTRKIKTD